MPLSNTEIQRAKEARHYHAVAGHPRDALLKAALDNRLWQGVDIVPRDVDNSNRLLGPCTACLESKFDAPEEPDAMGLKPEQPGDTIYFDTKPMSGRCMGGHYHALVGSDGYTGYITVNGLQNKLVTTIVQTLYNVIAFYRSYGWTTKHMVFDRDPSFLPLELKFPGILVTFYPAGMKNKVAERAIQDLCQKRRCMLNSLPYESPGELELKSYEAAAKCIGLLPNSKTGQNQCPHYLVTHLRSILPLFTFGTAVLAHLRSDKDKDQRAEYGMFVDQRGNNDFLIYNPTYKVIVSRRKVISVLAYPLDWKLIKKPRIVATKAAPTIEDILPNLRPTVLKAEEMLESITTQINPSATAKSEDDTIKQVNPPVSQSTFMDNKPIPSPSPVVSTAELLRRIKYQPFTLPPHSSHTHQSPESEAATTTPPSPVATTQPPSATAEAAAPQTVALRRSTREHRRPVRYTDAYVTAFGELHNLDNNVDEEDVEHDKQLPTNPYKTRFLVASSSRGVPVFQRIPPKVDKYKLNARIIAYRISLKVALRDPDRRKAESAESAMRGELKQLMESLTFEPAHYYNLSNFEKSKVIPSHMFLKEKFKADGSFDKIKARLVAGGNFVDTSQMGDIAAHVVNPITVMMLLNLAAIQRLDIMTIDVKGAFLIPQLGNAPEDLVFVKIDRICSGELVDMYPHLKEYIDSKGILTMRCKKSLYGLPSASFHWANHLSATLTKLGFTRMSGDKCAWTRGTETNMVKLCTHVDDVLCVGKPALLKEFSDKFSDEYECNVQTGVRHSYLGLDIVQDKRKDTVSVGQSGYRRDLVNKFEYLIALQKGGGMVPCTSNIVDHTASEYIDRTEFMSVVMSIMFLARFTRPDLLFAIGILSTHCNEPTRAHMRQAITVLKYIKESPDLAIVYKRGNLSSTIYADASHAIHTDGKGHGCLVLKMGSGVVYTRSFKLKMVTLSSTESEWIVLCEATTLAEWYRGMLIELGYAGKPVTILQDNTSSILIGTNGGNFARTKHLLVKRNKAREGVESGISVIQYCPTENMRADVGTKPLSRRFIFSHLRALGFMSIDRSDNGYRLAELVVPQMRVPRVTRK